MQHGVIERAPAAFEIALETLARAARIDVAHASLAHVREACQIRSYAEGQWSNELARMGSLVGMRVRAVDLSVHDVVGGSVDDLFPLVRLTALAGGVSCLTVVARTGNRVRVVVDDEPTAVLFDASALAALLEVSASACVTWTNGEPLAGLGPSAPEGAHGVKHPHPLQRLLSLVRLERDDLSVVVVYAVGVGLLSLATPLGIQFLVNTVAFGAVLQPLVVLTLLVLSGLALEGLLQALKAWVIERVQQRIFVRVALDMAFRLPRVRQEVLEARHAPEVVNHFFDVVTLQKGVASLFSDGVSIALSAIVGMLILAFYHPFLLAFDVVLLIGLGVVVFVFGRRAVETSLDESKSKHAVAAWLEEAAAQRTTLALGDGPTYVSARAERLTRTWLDRRRAHWGIVFRQLTSALALRALASAALLGLGGWLVMARQLTLGQLVAAELVVGTVVAGFAKLGKTFEEVYDLAAAAEKVGHVVDLDLDRAAGGVLPARSGGLELQTYGVVIRRGEIMLARGVDLELSPGSRTIVYGASRTGKSSLVDVLSGVRAPSDGTLIVDDVPAVDIAPLALRSTIAVVREPEVFQGTLFENIAMGRAQVDRAAARAAVTAVGLDDVVAALPDGLDTHLPSHAHGLGSTLPLLVTIARALAGSARMLLIDGALDRLDDSARRVVWRAVNERSWTVLVTTSRRELLDLGDSAYELAEQRLARAPRATLRLARTAHTTPTEES